MTEKQIKALERSVQDVTDRYKNAGYFPSAVVRVFDKDKTLCTVQTEGMSQDNIFDVASLTKIATTTMILELVHQKKLTLNAPILTYFENLQSDEYFKQKLENITLFKLLTHTTGFPAWYPFYLHKGEDFFEVLKKAIEKMRDTTEMEYSDINFLLLGKLLETVYQKPLDVCLKEELVDKLNLGYMTYRPELSPLIVPTAYGNINEVLMCKKMKVKYDKFRKADEEIRGTTHDGNAFYYFDDVAGHAGIFAKAEAYQKLCQFYMNTQKEIFILAQMEHQPTRGLGLQVGASYPHGCGHTGFTGTSIYFSREKNIGAVAFTNRLYYKDIVNENMTGDYRRCLHELMHAIHDIF